MAGKAHTRWWMTASTLDDVIEGAVFLIPAYADPGNGGPCANIRTRTGILVPKEVRQVVPAVPLPDEQHRASHCGRWRNRHQRELAAAHRTEW